jgi:segregation and condensation protein B
VSSENPVAGADDPVPDDVLAAGKATVAPGPASTGEAQASGHDDILTDRAGLSDGDVLAGGGILADSDGLGDGDVLGDDAGPGLRTALEAIMLVADEPVPEVLLAQVLERPRGEVGAALRELREEYTAQGRGFDLREVAGGWRFYTRADCAPLVERFVRDGQEVRLTQAALETLAVVAYRQPVSRARVSAVRGVNCDGVMRTLVLRGLVDEFGTDTDTGAILYRTTSYFLERMGLTSLADLPDLAPFLPDDFADIEDN